MPGRWLDCWTSRLSACWDYLWHTSFVMAALFALLAAGLIALSLVMLIEVPPSTSVLIAIGLSLMTSTVLGAITVVMIRNLHSLVNSRMTELLAETQRAATLAGRVAERADIRAQEYAKQLHLEQLAREERELSDGPGPSQPSSA